MERRKKSDEEGDDEENKKRRKEKKEKKGLKEKIKEKFPDNDHVDTHVPIEVVHSEPFHATPIPQPAHHHDEVAPDEKKGLLEKIKDKLPGQHKKADEDLHHAEVAVPASTTAATVDVEGQEKKGFLEKIKEKIPGFHPKPSEVEKKEVEKI